MARHDASWTTDEVANRFHEAAITARRLPPVRVQGYFNTWPPIVRQAWEVLGADDAIYRSYPPTPQAVERMLEAMRWVQWLEVEQRHLVWMRADGYRWREITRRFGCDRTTAWRRWNIALLVVSERLNLPASARVLG
jgi:hypothetical protein